MKALAAGDFTQADRGAAQLLAGHSDRFVPFVILGDIASAQGRSAEALAMYRRALQILEANSDKEYLRRASNLKREDDIIGLRDLIRRHGGH